VKYLFAFTIAAASVVLSGCNEAPVATGPTNNPNVPVAMLFEHDGCRVYRFWDGRYHYYATCGGRAVGTMGHETTTCGKNCWRTHDTSVQTQE
jgi:hypothetical protein